MCTIALWYSTRYEMTAWEPVKTAPHSDKVRTCLICSMPLIDMELSVLSFEIVELSMGQLEAWPFDSSKSVKQ